MCIFSSVYFHMELHIKGWIHYEDLTFPSADQPVLIVWCLPSFEKHYSRTLQFLQCDISICNDNAYVPLDITLYVIYYLILLGDTLKICWQFCLRTRTKLIFFQAATRDFSSNQESPKGNKSALTTRSSSSISSITKKRVLFLDQENELASHQVQGTDNSQTSNLAWNASRREATLGVSRSVENLSVDPLSSWDCSPLASPNKSTDLKTQGSTRNSDSDNDWDLSR